jgi:hypothetical protein
MTAVEPPSPDAAGLSAGLLLSSLAIELVRRRFDQWADQDSANLRDQLENATVQVLEASEQSNAESSVTAGYLVSSAAAELVRREFDPWANYETSRLQELAAGALSVLSAQSHTIGNCQWDGLPYHLLPDGRWCCIDNHCIP